MKIQSIDVQSDDVVEIAADDNIVEIVVENRIGGLHDMLDTSSVVVHRQRHGRRFHFLVNLVDEAQLIGW